jgi:hypothetical protein
MDLLWFLDQQLMLKFLWLLVVVEEVFSMVEVAERVVLELQQYH